MQPTPHPEKDSFYVQAGQVGCDGGISEGVLGHPLVFLELVDNGQVVCPYCSRKYVHKEG